MRSSEHPLVVWLTKLYMFTQVVISETSTSSDTCTDLDPKCADWASRGECQSNPVWMMANCRISCRCQGGDRAWRLRDCIASHYDNPTNSNLSHVVSVESIRINHVDVDKEKQMVGVFGRMVLNINKSRDYDKQSTRSEPHRSGLYVVGFFVCSSL